jgi:xanthine dehydrogenase accessory factor
VVTDPVIDATRQLADDDRLGVVVTVIAGPHEGAKAVLDDSASLIAGDLPPDLLRLVTRDGESLMRTESTVTLGYEDTEVFYEVIAPRPRLFVFGAVHVAQELVEHAALLGFHTVVADPRPAFVTPDRFPDVDELRVGWPDEVVADDDFDARTFVVVLTHDRRFEDPLWPLLLPTPVRYIGAMGSAKTTARRRERLIGAGFTPEQVDRIHGPVGLDIGSRTAGETAIAILGEMIAVRYRRDQEPELAGKPMRA